MQESILSFVEKQAPRSYFTETEAVLNQPVPFWTFPTLPRHLGHLQLALCLWEFNCKGLSFQGKRAPFLISVNFKKPFLQAQW